MSGWRRPQAPRLRAIDGKRRALPVRQRPVRRQSGRRPWRKVLYLLTFAVAVIGAVESGLWAGEATGGCRIVWPIDGDTVRAWCPGRGMESVRLTGFDTPEVFSPRCLSEWVAGTIATGALAWHVVTADETVLVLNGRDRYGRALGRLNLDGRNVADIMVAEGHARRYSGGRRAGWCG